MSLGELFEDEPAKNIDVVVEGRRVTAGPDTTAADLKAQVGLSEDEILTYRTPQGFEALNDDDVVATEVDEGAELQAQPLADSYVFG
ncbi:hypothetical protein [Salinigranum marinum]|uniref:hypothetical protein n=1 Tax=Salinigranum marinum TaxID=1515595 RepID=UPI002989A80C|nr:hypothetical protein [Salinigranum marinum]